MGIIWITPVLVIAITIYVVSYTLLRTSGDGRSAWKRLLHPKGGALQEEYGGTGNTTDDTKAEPPKK